MRGSLQQVVRQEPILSPEGGLGVGERGIGGNRGGRGQGEEKKEKKGEKDEEGEEA